MLIVGLVRSVAPKMVTMERVPLCLVEGFQGTDDSQEEPRKPVGVQEPSASLGGMNRVTPALQL